MLPMDVVGTGRFTNRPYTVRVCFGRVHADPTLGQRARHRRKTTNIRSRRGARLGARCLRPMEVVATGRFTNRPYTVWVRLGARRQLASATVSREWS